MGAAMSQASGAMLATPMSQSASPATQDALQRKRLAAMVAKKNQPQPAPTIGTGVSALKQRLGE